MTPSAEACHHGRITPLRPVRHQNKERRSHRDQHVRSQTGRLPRAFPLMPQQPAQNGGHAQPQHNVGQPRGGKQVAKIGGDRFPQVLADVFHGLALQQNRYLLRFC
jgi:hypothetical protein